MAKAMPTWRWPHGDNERCYWCGERGATDVEHAHGICDHPDNYVCNACFRGMAHRRCNLEIGGWDASERAS